MLTTTAYAQTAQGAPASGVSALLTSPLPMMVIVFAIFYFLVIRPQQKAQKEQKARLAAAQKGDTVITGGGVYGKVTGVDGDTIMVEIAQNVRVKVLKSTLMDVLPRNPGKPAND
ncbi:MAG: preprotein translocase subunit YajC [Alphaproteobacteria bacterium]|nr:preprotein translocase subunit YajC [Alphaproteobacteria bacterium]MDE2041929.1 preprotein translocase subunit YajC [Alphaproteobacteria bacterium]